MTKIIPTLSKMWHKVLNLESTLFSTLNEELRLKELSSKEQKLISILDFAEFISSFIELESYYPRVNA